MHSEFTSSRLLIDGVSMTIKFLPLCHPEHAYHFIRKFCDYNRFCDHDDEQKKLYIGDMGEHLIDTVADELQKVFIGKSELWPTDKASFRRSRTYEYTAKLRGDIHLSFKQITGIKSIKSKTELYGPWLPDQKPRYDYDYHIQDSDSQIRIEWNPQMANISILGKFFNFLSTHTSLDPLNDIKITRFDWAIDVPYNVDLSLVTTKKIVDISTYNGKNGQTKYLGSTKSDSFIRIYDKKQQLAKKFGESHPNKDYFRFELENKKGFMLNDTFAATENIFEMISFLCPDKLINCDDLLISSYKIIADLTGEDFDSVVSDQMKGHERKKIWRLKKKYRTYESESIQHPSAIFEENSIDIWEDFRNNLLFLFKGEK